MSLSTRSAAFVVTAAGLLCLTPAGYAQAPAAPGAAPAATQAGQPNQPPPVVSQEVAADRHITFRIYAPKAQVVRLSGGDIPGVGPGVAGHQGREWRVGSHGRPRRARRVPLFLQRRRRDDDRSREPLHQRVEHADLEPGLRAGRRQHGHAQRAARRRRGGDLLLDDAQDVPADARLHAARLRDEHGQVPRVLSAARRRRQRRLVDVRRPRRASSSTI